MRCIHDKIRDYVKIHLEVDALKDGLLEHHLDIELCTLCMDITPKVGHAPDSLTCKEQSIFERVLKYFQGKAPIAMLKTLTLQPHPWLPNHRPMGKDNNA